MILFIASEVMFFVAWFWAYFDVRCSRRRPTQFARVELHRRRLAAEGHRDLRPLAPAAAQHADPADLGHHRHLGAPRAARRRPQGRSRSGLCADHRCSALHRSPASRPIEYTHAELRASCRQHLRLDLLHGDRLPRLPRDHRHDLPDRLPAPRLCAATSRPKQHLGFEVAAWYWHFVDVVWLFLFACIYVWGAGAQHAAGTDRAD